MLPLGIGSILIYVAALRAYLFGIHYNPFWDAVSLLT